MAAEMHDRRLELAQLAEQVDGLHRPSRHEIEPIPMATPLELTLYRSSFLIECEPIGSGRVGGQKQDHMLCHVGLSCCDPKRPRRSPSGGPRTRSYNGSERVADRTSLLAFTPARTLS